MAMALVTTQRWNSDLGRYVLVDHEIELNDYPGLSEAGEGTVAAPYGIEDSPRSLRSQVGRYSALWTQELSRVGQCRSRVRRAQEALEAGDMDALRTALEEAFET